MQRRSLQETYKTSLNVTLNRSLSLSSMPARYAQDSNTGNPRCNSVSYGISDVIGRKNVIHVTDEALNTTVSMQPFLIHFKFLGLLKVKTMEWEEECAKPWRNLSIRCWILMTTVFLLLLFKVATAISYAIHSGVKVAPVAVSDSLEFVVGFGTTLHLFKSQTKLANTFDKNWRMVQPFPRSRIVALKRKAIFLVVLAWIYFILLLGQGVAVISLTPQRFMKIFFKKYFENCPVYVGYVARICRVIAYAIVRFICALYISLFIILCLQIKETLKQLISFFADCSNRDRVNSTHVVELMELWDCFSCLVKDVDSTYAAVVFMWYGDLLHRIVHYFPTAIELLGSKNNVLDGCVLAILGVFYSFLFVSMTISASSIADSSEDLLHLVRRMSCKLQPLDPYVYQDMVILMSTLNYQNVYLTGWNCFVIRKYLILTVVGMVMTYIVLINQILQN